MPFQRTLVIGDIHGHFLALKKVLKLAQFDENVDRLICVGDYVDGGPQSFEVVDFLLKLKDNHPGRHVFIKGNHDHMFSFTLQRWLAGQSSRTLLQELPDYFRDELKTTLDSYEKHDRPDVKKHLELFFRTLSPYHIEGHRLFVHGGFNPNLGFHKSKAIDLSSLWTDRSLYTTAKMWSSRGQPRHFDDFDEIFIGHTPTIRDDKWEPEKHGNVINLDQGIKIGGRLSVYDLTSGQFYQSEA